MFVLESSADVQRFIVLECGKLKLLDRTGQEEGKSWRQRENTYTSLNSSKLVAGVNTSNRPIT